MQDALSLNSPNNGSTPYPTPLILPVHEGAITTVRKPNKAFYTGHALDFPDLEHSANAKYGQLKDSLAHHNKKHADKLTRLQRHLCTFLGRSTSPSCRMQQPSAMTGGLACFLVEVDWSVVPFKASFSS
eukprot:661647-Pelagomonas_calceolata.AAC.1